MFLHCSSGQPCLCFFDLILILCFILVLKAVFENIVILLQRFHITFVAKFNNLYLCCFRKIVLEYWLFLTVWVHFWCCLTMGFFEPNTIKASFCIRFRNFYVTCTFTTLFKLLTLSWNQLLWLLCFASVFFSCHESVCWCVFRLIL